MLKNIVVMTVGAKTADNYTDWTVQLEFVSCGKCKGCSSGIPCHGPYWYGYRRQGWRLNAAGRRRGGRLVCKYIGKELDYSKLKN